MVVINIQKKDLWFLSSIMVFLIGVGFVVAYNVNWETTPGEPAVMGHTPDEIVGGVGGGGAPTFITPVSLVSGVAAASGTIDVSSYVPVGTKVIILEGSYASGFGNNSIKIRKDSSSPWYILIGGGNLNVYTNGDNLGQGIFPISDSMTFDYMMTMSTSFPTLINLVGYF